MELLPSYSWRAIWHWAYHIQRAAIFAADECRVCKQQKLLALHLYLWLQRLGQFAVTSQQVEFCRWNSSTSKVRPVDKASELRHLFHIFFFTSVVLQCSILRPCHMHSWLDTQEIVYRGWKHAHLLISSGIKLTFRHFTWKTKDGLKSEHQHRRWTTCTYRLSICQSNALDTSCCTARHSEGAGLYCNIYWHWGNKLLHHSQRAGWGKTRQTFDKLFQHWLSEVWKLALKFLNSPANQLYCPLTVVVHRSARLPCAAQQRRCGSWQ